MLPTIAEKGPKSFSHHYTISNSLVVSKLPFSKHPKGGVKVLWYHFYIFGCFWGFNLYWYFQFLNNYLLSLLVPNPLSSEPGSQTYATTTDAAYPVMFYEDWCSGSESSITDCSGGILSAGVVTCGQRALGVRCRGRSLLPKLSDVYIIKGA